ncbi:MAG TPA: polymer-forming cytoskeletal protein [Thermoanaerobaculia bacterium]|nr:polymer-forming cytoskeletal protein [Thermoanaerobaculia bacterium]
MFGKAESTNMPAPVEQAKADSRTVIGVGARFVGNLSAEEEVVIAGRLEGKVEASRRVEVAAQGEVDGDIEALSVYIAGRLQGQIRAGERAELAATAVVEGGIESPKIVIAEGAQLTGSVGMKSKTGKG